MTAPVFSIMTPVYNGADFIARSYAVLCEQTFQDWEWVVVDDGSTDGTADLVRKIDDSRVKLVTYPKNQGRGYARTVALEASSGDWVVLWDVDDIYFPDRLEQINAIRQQGGYDYFCSYSVVVDNNLKIKGVRGFLPANRIIPKYFVHHTLACPLKLAEQIGYDILDGKGGPGEDTRIVLTLAAGYRGCFFDNALAVYQEDRDVNLTKSIDTNRAQSKALRELYFSGVLPKRRSAYLSMMFRRHVKLSILHLMRLAPSLYQWTVQLRSLGDTVPGFQLSAQRREFIERIRRMNTSSVADSHSPAELMRQDARDEIHAPRILHSSGAILPAEGGG